MPPAPKTLMQTALNPPQKLADSARRRKALISLTPLIDVVFILLVFFMLASSFLDWRAVTLDTSAAGAATAPEQAPFVVQVDTDALLLNGEAISLAALLAQARACQPGDQAVVLQPMGETSVQALLTLLDALAAAGIQPLKLVDDPAWQPAKAAAAAEVDSSGRAGE